MASDRSWDAESRRQLGEPRPMALIEIDAVGSALPERQSLGVSGNEDRFDAGRAGRRSDVLGQLCRLSGQSVATGKPFRFHQEEDDVVTPSRWGTSVAGSTPGQSTSPELEYQTQAETLISLLATQGEYRSQWRLIEYSRVCGRIPIVVEEPTARNRPFGDVVGADLSLGDHAGSKIRHDRLI